MPRYFLDSSALVKRYRQEVGSRWILELAAPPAQLIVARLAHLEVASAIVRRGRESPEAARQVGRVLATLDSDFANIFQIVELTELVISRALDLVRTHGLRAADAIQLASALFLDPGPAVPVDLWLVSADNDLNAAATAEGLLVENPNNHA